LSGNPPRRAGPGLSLHLLTLTFSISLTVISRPRATKPLTSHYSLSLRFPPQACTGIVRRTLGRILKRGRPSRGAPSLDLRARGPRARPRAPRAHHLRRRRKASETNQRGNRAGCNEAGLTDAPSALAGGNEVQSPDESRSAHDARRLFGAIAHALSYDVILLNRPNAAIPCRLGTFCQRLNRLGRVATGAHRRNLIHLYVPAAWGKSRKAPSSSLGIPGVRLQLARTTRLAGIRCRRSNRGPRRADGAGLGHRFPRDAAARAIHRNSARPLS